MLTYQAGARGISLLFATGDAGAEGAWDECNAVHDKVTAAFPAGSPWATAVGGIDLHRKTKTIQAWAVSHHTHTYACTHSHYALTR